MSLHNILVSPMRQFKSFIGPMPWFAQMQRSDVVLCRTDLAAFHKKSIMKVKYLTYS